MRRFWVHPNAMQDWPPEHDDEDAPMVEVVEAFEVEGLQDALREAISWSYGVDVTPERRDEVERLVR